MKKIGLISDTHSAIHPKLFDFFKDVDEIWHAGDFGDVKVVETLQKFKRLRGVYGNIDGTIIRQIFPQIDIFWCERMKIVMMHIGGYPGKYTPEAFATIQKERPGIFISGHSHILKVIYDKKNKLLHLNPGAAGNYGIHHVITMLRFTIDEEEIKDLEIFEAERSHSL
ncbi:MAG: metallophosphatase family protein [Bacteroidales bacterium]|jgi:putative phosphoesterase|nr:metallophosphatase family protein [Bacteroidales bacterium]